MTAKEMIQSQKAQAQSVVDGFDALDAQLDIDLKGQYDQGFSDGKASMGNPGDKLFDQAEVDAMLKPLQDGLVAKEAQITQLQSDFDAFKAQSQIDINSKILTAVKSIKDAYDAEQSSESASEKGFSDALDQVVASVTPPPIG